MSAAVNPPLTLGEILDRTIQLYRRNFLLFVGISAAPAACYVLIYGSTSLYLTSHATRLQGTPNLQLILTFFGIIAGFLLLGLPLLVAISALALSALNFAASLRNSQQPVTIRAAYAYAFKRFWRYLGILALQLLFSLLVPGTVFAGIIVIGVVSATLLTAAAGNPALAGVASILLVLISVAVLVVMVLIWIRFSLAFPASLVEDLKIWPSMQRSNRLSQGSRGRIFVMYLLVAILVAVIYYALVLPVDLVLALVFFKSNQMITLLARPPLILQVVNLFISFLQRAFAMPVYAIALVLFYNDQRTRHEGYDIELLMARAGWSTAPSAGAAIATASDLPFELEARTHPAIQPAATAHSQTEPVPTAPSGTEPGIGQPPAVVLTEPAAESTFNPGATPVTTPHPSPSHSEAAEPPSGAAGA